MAFKLQVLGAAEPATYFDPKVPLVVGSVVCQHVKLSGGEGLHDESTSQEIIDAALELGYLSLEEHHDAQRPDGTGVPIRALVLDSLTLPDGSEEVSRSRLVGFVQAVEARGVTPVLVEEASVSTSQRVAFAVDVVLSTSFTAEPDSGALTRTLVLTKSRYAHSSPGPHTLGLEGGRPVVWPDIRELELLPRREPPGYLSAIGAPQGMLIATRRSLFAAAERKVRHGPSRTLTRWRSGVCFGLLPVTELRISSRSTLTVECDGRREQVALSAPPSAWLCTVERLLADGDGPVQAFVDGSDALLIDTRFRDAASVFFAAMLQMGLSVLVVSSREYGAAPYVIV